MNSNEIEVYGLLADNESRKLFVAMKQLAETNDRTAYMKYFPFSQEAYELAEKLKTEPYYIYGAGTAGKKLLTVLEYFGVLDNCRGIMDKNENLWGKTMMPGEMPVSLPYYPDKQINKQTNRQIPILSPEISMDSGSLVLLGVSPLFGPYVEILNYLRSIGVSEDQIISPYYLFLAKDKQYFADDIILSKLGEDEIFVDVGCLDFSSSKEFLSYCLQAKKIYAFEPDRKQFEVCKNNMEGAGFSKVILNQLALWDSTTILKFDEGGQGNMGGGIVSEQLSSAEAGIQAVRFDDIVDTSDKITFIKMDIEGAEMNALRGMEKTIKRDKPKLAICIYHRPYDYVDIPTYIYSLRPDYRMYIRNYHINLAETILYCV